MSPLHAICSISGTAGGKASALAREKREDDAGLPRNSLMLSAWSGRSNREMQFINVKIEGTYKPYFYTCSHAAAALHLSNLLKICQVSETSLRQVLNSIRETACKKHISRLDIEDREKAELLGDAHALEEAYRASTPFQTSSALNSLNKAKRGGGLKAKHAGIGKRKNALLP